MIISMKIQGAWTVMTDTVSLEQLKKNPSFCSMAWVHQFMDPTGRVKPCCRFEETHRPPENNLHDQELKDVFYGPWMDVVRSKMLKGDQVDGCKRCYQEEDAGKKSLRQRYNDNLRLPVSELINFEEPKLRWLELAISNQCNLACRMCDSRYSWKWFDEEKESFGKTLSKDKRTSFNIENVYPFIPHLVHLKFTGGEPLITPEHWTLIKRLTTERDCSQIFINYSTNCTIRPKEQWINLWRQFKYIEFALSYDSANPQEAEYIRWPAKYDDIELATKDFINLSKEPHFFIILRTTVSLLNVWHLPETIQWWIDNNPTGKKLSINPTHLTHPQILSVTVLPKHIKQRIEDKYSSFMGKESSPHMVNSLSYIVNLMNSVDDSKKLPQLKSYLEKTDAYRKQSFSESYPFFSDLFDGVEKA